MSRFELLGDNGLPGISLEHGSGEIEQSWILNLRWPWHHNVPEADVDLHWNSRFRQHRVELDSNALVVGVLLDATRLNRRAIEFNPVGLCDYIAHGAYEVGDVV